LQNHWGDIEGYMGHNSVSIIENVRLCDVRSYTEEGMKKMAKKRYVRRPRGDRGLLFPPSAYTTSATVNVYKCMAEATGGFPDEKTVARTEAALAEELRDWSIENRL
jgi:hypothetical protein